MPWKTKELSEISLIIKDGLHKTPKYSKEGIPFISTTNLVPFSKEFNFNSYRKYITKESYDELFKTNKPQKGDILISKCGTIGVSQLVRTDFNFGIFVGLALVRLNDEVSGEYFEYYINSDLAQREMDNLCTGTTRKTLALQALKKLKISYPSIEEQKRIVAILDKAFESITKTKENAEKNLNNAKEIFESYLQSVFEKKCEGWEEMTLGEVCEIINGGTPDTKVKGYWDGENLWITPKDMGKLNNIFVDETERKITDSGLKNSSAKLLPINSIILSSRAPIGHLAINKKPMSTNQGCKGIIPRKNLDFLFLYYFLKKSIGLLDSLGSGTTFKEVSGSKLAEVLISFPPLKEQQSIVKKLDTLSAETKKLEAIYNQKLADLEELKKSILEKAFKGELTKESP